MLEVRIKQDGEKVFSNLEVEFTRLRLQDTELNRKLISEIEQGRYLDSSRFIDRFGTALYLSELSTGCKGALVVANNPDKEYDITECGWNARDAIIHHCTDGRIKMPYPYMLVYFDSPEDECDVLLDGYRFRKIRRLNYYLQEEMPDEPDFDIDGVERVV